MRKATEMGDHQRTVKEVLNVDDQKKYESTAGVERCHMYDILKLINDEDRIELKMEII